MHQPSRFTVPACRDNASASGRIEQREGVELTAQCEAESVELMRYLLIRALTVGLARLSPRTTRHGDPQTARRKTTERSATWRAAEIDGLAQLMR